MNYLDYNFTLQPTAERFHLGTPNWVGMVALNAAIELLQEVGIERIAQQILRLNDALITDLGERGYRLAASTAPEQRSGIVVAEVPDAMRHCQYLNEAGVIVTPRGKGVRVARTSTILLRKFCKSANYWIVAQHEVFQWPLAI